jgi:hypothetical protein
MTHIATYNIPAYRNDTLRFFIDFFDENGDDYDLLQYSEYKMQVKNSPTSAQSVIELDLGSGLSISNGNRMSIEVTKEEMAVQARDFHYDLEGQNDPGDRRTILKGLFQVESDITR